MAGCRSQDGEIVRRRTSRDQETFDFQAFDTPGLPGPLIVEIGPIHAPFRPVVLRAFFATLRM